MRYFLVLLASACVAVAQSGSGMQKTLTNRDVVVLAKAGFSEEFIIDMIQNSRTRFDTSAAGLVDLVKEGLNERVVRVMAGAASSPEAPAAAAAAANAAASPSPMEMGVPGAETKTHTQVIKPSRIGMAITSETPYYESRSLLWGLFKIRVGVGAVPHGDQIVTPQTGSSSNGNRMGNFPMLVAPSGSAKRYVVIP